MIIKTTKRCSRQWEKTRNSSCSGSKFNRCYKKLASEFKKEHKNADIKFNYGGSGALRKQIESGAPVDVFMSANTKDVDALKDKNKAHDTYKYAKNSLVLIGDKDSNYTSVKDLKGNDKLALGEVKTVPAGKYAKQYLDNNNLFKEVESKIVYAKRCKTSIKLC